MRFNELWIFSKFTVNKSTFSKSTNQHFLRVNCLYFCRNSNLYLKMSIKKHLNFELLYNKKEKIPIDFLIDEIGVDSYFFTVFWTFMLSKTDFSDWVQTRTGKFPSSQKIYKGLTLTFFYSFFDVYVVQNRLLRLIYSKLFTAKLFIPSLQWFLKLKILLVQVRSQTSRDLLSKTNQLRVVISNLHQNQRTWLPTETSATFIWLHTTNSINLIKNRGNANCMLFFYLNRQYFLFLQQTIFGRLFFWLFLCTILLIWKSSLIP